MGFPFFSWSYARSHAFKLICAAVFLRMDGDKDGKLDTHELYYAMQDVHAKAMAEFDAEGDKTLTEAQFVEFASAFFHKNVRVVNLLKIVAAAAVKFFVLPEATNQLRLTNPVLKRVPKGVWGTVVGSAMQMLGARLPMGTGRA